MKFIQTGACPESRKGANRHPAAFTHRNPGGCCLPPAVRQSTVHSFRGCSVVFVLLCLILLIDLPGSVRAQSTSGSAVGTITDSSRAAVVGANVELTNTDTGDKRDDATNATGGYEFINVPPGNYRLDLQTPGFKHFTQTGVVIEVGSSTRVDVVLQIGEVSQSVEVTTEAALLETQQATVGQVVEGRSVTDMPLNGRNVLNLVALAPGVVPLQNVQAASAASGLMGTFAGGDYMIAGGIPDAGLELLDGGTINTGYINALAFVPSQDAVQEFKIESNNLSPEYGGTEDGVVTMVTKSGTNQFHGSVFEYLRNTLLNANTFFGNRAGLPRPPFIQNQFGATLGGPVRRNKLFFFGSWEAVRTALGTTTTYTVPTAAMVNAAATGDLSSITTPITDPGTFDPTYTTFTPYNPSACPPTDTTTTKGCIFTNNMLPPSRIDPTSKAMLAWWAAATPALGSKNNYVATLMTHPSIDQYLARGDWSLSDKQRIFARFVYQNVGNNGAPPYGYMPNVRNNNAHALQGVMGDDYTFSPTTVLNVRLAYLRWVSLQIPACAPCDISFTGWPAATIAQMVPTPGIPLVNVTGLSANGGASQTIPAAEDNDAVTGSITKILGRHTLKFGGEFRRQPNNYGQTQNGTVEAFTFTNAFTGNAWASYLLGFPFTTTELTAIFPASMDYYAGAYLNDNLQLNTRLSLNYGLRWEYPGYWTERHDRQTVWLPNATNPLAGPTGLSLKGDVALVNTPAYPGRTNLNPHYDLFSPRLGLAFRLTDRNVIRAGFGIVFAPTAILEQNAQPYNSPINSARTIIQPTTQPINAFHNPYPGGILQPVGRAANYDQAAILGQTIDVPVPSEPSTYIEQWNAGFEHDFGHQIVVDIAYVGLKGEHLQPPAGGNDHGLGLDELAAEYEICGTDDTQPQCNGHLLTDQVPNPFYNLVPSSSSMGGVTIPYGQLLRPYPQYYNLYNPAAAGFYILYNSVQAKLQKRLAQGGNLLLSYTYGNDTGNADGTTLFTGTQTGLLQDFNNLKGEVSQLTYNLPQNFVASYVVDLPFGRGRRFLGSQGGLVDEMVSGWGLDGITSYRSGYPLVLSEQATTLTANFGGGNPRPNVTPGCATVNSSGSAYSRTLSGATWFNTTCYTQTSNFAYGNEPRVDPAIRGQGVANWDFSLVKGTPIGDRINVQFRAEVFNAFNRVQFGLPNATCCTATNSTFGTISTQQNNPRQFQFALKTTF